MKLSTLEKYLNILIAIKESKLSISTYCKEKGINIYNIHNIISKIKDDTDNRSDIANRILELYSELSPFDAEEILFTEKIETDDKAETSYERDQDGRIKYYKYEIFKKNKRPLSGRLTREEMATIYRLYSYYGDSLTRRAISRHFPDLSLVDFKRILRAFNIYKDSSPFPPHYIEEFSEEELREIQLREKENSFLRKAEEDNIKNTEKLLKKFAQENIELKKQLDKYNNIKIEIPTNLKTYRLKYINNSDINMTIYISDMHIGSIAYGVSGYYENIKYGENEVNRRLEALYNKILEIGELDTLNIVLMGDNIDSCQVANKTASLTHDMPENMSPIEQGQVFLKTMLSFINNLVTHDVANKIRIFSVPCGNHPGSFELAWNTALMSMINANYPDIETTLWNEIYGIFTQNSHTFICCHGKHSEFQKKPLPLNMDDKSQLLIRDWLYEKNISGNNIHFVKGDLHSNNLNSCKRFDYRNVLSLYGASDYSSVNYIANSYGVSYDLFIKDNLIRGTFENI